MRTFKERQKKNKFVGEVQAFIDEFRNDLMVRQTEFLSSLIQLINVKFRKLSEEERVAIMCECVNGLFNEQVCRNTYEWLRDNGMCNESSYLEVAFYYFRKYVLKKEQLQLL